jgi:hypothetical protein
MSDITREEMDAKLEAAEARVETKLVGIDGKIDRLSDQLSSAMSQVSLELRTTREAAERGESASNEARKAASQVKWNILFTAIGVLAVAIAFWGIWMQGMEMIGTLISAQPPTAQSSGTAGATGN